MWRTGTRRRNHIAIPPGKGCQRIIRTTTIIFPTPLQIATDRLQRDPTRAACSMTPQKRHTPSDRSQPPSAEPYQRRRREGLAATHGTTGHQRIYGLVQAERLENIPPKRGIPRRGLVVAATHRQRRTPHQRGRCTHGCLSLNVVSIRSYMPVPRCSNSSNGITNGASWSGRASAEPTPEGCAPAAI